MSLKVVQIPSGFEGLQADYSSTLHHSGMPHYHAHNTYEISLILNGKMHILLEDAVESGTGSFLLLTPPEAPHCVRHDPDVTYSRQNVSFTLDFVEQYVPEWQRLLQVFGSKGRILPLTPQQKENLYTIAEAIHNETDPFRQRLRLLLYLAEIEEVCRGQSNRPTLHPEFVTKALQHLHSHYPQKITAEQLAWQAGVSRTTLMTGFKRYTGNTVGEYLAQYRLQMAIRLLKQGHTQQAAAEQCGFCDAGTLIRTFRRYFGTTPYKYLHP